MRILMKFELARPELPLDYRPAFMAFLKRALTSCGDEYFNRFYQAQNPIIKKFTFHVKLGKTSFTSTNVKFFNNIISLVLSTADHQEAMLLYNAVLQEKAKPFPLAAGNSMRLLSLKILPQRNVDKNEVLIKMQSPLVVREHNRVTGKDYYYDYSNEQFLDKLKQIVSAQLSMLNMEDVAVDDFSFVPIMPKRTVITLFGSKVNVSLGVFKLSGNKQLLNFLYYAGIGSRRSQGMGMFEILA